MWKSWPQPRVPAQTRNIRRRWKMRKKKTLPATITLLVNSEQAQLLAHLEESNSLHLAFVYRGARANAEKFLAAQDAFFAEPEAEADRENSQPEAPADGGQPTEGTEEQEVETTDGE